MSNAAVAAISVALYILLAPGVGGLLQGVDRKATARMQGRQGPPLLQSFYDVGKLLGKETKYMNHIGRPGLRSRGLRRRNRENGSAHGHRRGHRQPVSDPGGHHL